MASAPPSPGTATLSVLVKLFAAYQEAYGKEELCLDVSAGTTVSQLGDRLIAQRPQLARWRDVTRYGINLEFVEGDRPLQDGDEVVFIPPVSGG